jgi:acetyl-CoA/propionyl-CoA carboxylase biotin carboxyl carrier protein
MLRASERLAADVHYVGVGTIEFLYAGPGSFYFLEMNTRIQVEHTITEAVTGLDLVRESIRLAAGENVTQGIDPRGHAIEARINAEDPAQNFQPGPGLLEVYREPGGVGVRVDSGVYQGFTIPGDYDSLVAKLIILAPDRHMAIERMLRALSEYRIEGVPSTIDVITNIVNSDDFRAGRVTTDWLDAGIGELIGPSGPTESVVGPSPTEPKTVTVEVNGKRFEVRLFDGAEQSAGQAPDRGQKRSQRAGRVTSANVIVSAMRGTVLSILKAAGDDVAEGERVAVVEAMKMENEMKSPRAGRVARVLASVGDTVESKQPLMELEP